MVAAAGERMPFFSIGITTYDRHDLLVEAIRSVLAQEFADFEIIVGNDYQAETLTPEMLGIDDPRLVIVNHPVNLREVGNMNALLAAARGHYFTWLFDDDLLEPDFLSVAHALLCRPDPPSALFTGYRILWGEEPFLPVRRHGIRDEHVSGPEFLDRYFSGRLKIISTAGLYRTDLLRGDSPPMEELCRSAVGLYCEYLLLAKCARFDRIAVLDAPLAVMRAHAGSWSESNLELEKYREAGQALVQRSAVLFRQAGIAGAAYRRVLLGVCALHLYTFAYKSARREAARGAYGPGAALQALGRLKGEHVRTRALFGELAGTSPRKAALLFLPKRLRHAALVAGTLAVHLGRKAFPGLLKRMRPATGV